MKPTGFGNPRLAGSIARLNLGRVESEETADNRDAQALDRFAAAEDVRRAVDRVQRGDCVPSDQCPVTAGWYDWRAS